MSTINNLFGGLVSAYDVIPDNSNNRLKSKDSLQATIDELSSFNEITQHEITLVASDWVGEATPYTCKVELEDANALSVIGLHLSALTTHAQRQAIDDAVLTGGKQGEGYFTLYAFGTKPQIDINLRISLANNVPISKYFDLSKAMYNNGPHTIPLEKIFNTISNPNLLINPSFTVNQKGQSYYVGSDTEELSSIDCWTILGDGTILEKTTDGIKLSNTTSNPRDLLKQSICITKDLYDKQLTVSVLVSDMIANSASIKLITDNGVELLNEKIVTGSNTFTTENKIPTGCNYINCIISSLGNRSSVSISTMKVEVGDVLTPIIPRPYVEELVLCKNYIGVSEESSSGFKNIVITPSDFKDDLTFNEYPYRVDIPCDGVTEQHYAMVLFNQTDALSGIFAHISNTSENTVTIYANKIPSTNITIESIICTKVVNKEVIS